MFKGFLFNFSSLHVGASGIKIDKMNNRVVGIHDMVNINLQEKGTDDKNMAIFAIMLNDVNPTKKQAPTKPFIIKGDKIAQ